MIAGLVVIALCLALSILVTWLAHRDLNRPEPPCEHPWYISGRCIVCGEPK